MISKESIIIQPVYKLTFSEEIFHECNQVLLIDELFQGSRFPSSQKAVFNAPLPICLLKMGQELRAP